MEMAPKKNYDKLKGVSRRVAQAILDSGLTQADIASKMGIFPTAISRWKSGSTEPAPANLKKLADVVKCDVGWLMGGEKTQPEVNVGNTKEEESEMLKDELLEARLKIIELHEELANVKEQLSKYGSQLSKKANGQ